MMQLIAFIIFIISLVAILVMVGKKIPVLITLPQNGSHGFKKPAVVLRVQKKWNSVHFHLFEKQMLLHKVLSFIKVWTLKIETKIDQLLHGIRKKAQELDKKVKNKK